MSRGQDEVMKMVAYRCGLHCCWTVHGLCILSVQGTKESHVMPRHVGVNWSRPASMRPSRCAKLLSLRSSDKLVKKPLKEGHCSMRSLKVKKLYWRKQAHVQHAIGLCQFYIDGSMVSMQMLKIL